MRQVPFPFVKETSAAELSGCRTYRYALYRSLDEEAWDAERNESGRLRHTVVFVMLNPSKADERTNDPTILKCIKFGRRWGMDRLAVVNLFPYRATDPTELRTVGEFQGWHYILDAKNNDEVITRVVKQATQVVCAWGNHGHLHSRSTQVRELLVKATPIGPLCFSMTNKKEPAHPLYQRDDAPLIPLP